MTHSCGAFVQPGGTVCAGFLNKRPLSATCRKSRAASAVRTVSMATRGPRTWRKIFGVVPVPFGSDSSAESATAAEEARGFDWDGLRRVVRISAFSLSVMMCATRGVNANTSSQVHVPRDSASDVEAAALTLGAVTVGGLVMRAVLASRRDEDKEREKLAAECARLEQEEMLRARRLQRKAMERVEGDDDLPEDDALQSSLLKRLEGLKEGDDAEEGGKKDIDVVEGILMDKPSDKKSMRNTPIPDRGTGSALLERPDGNDSNDDGGNDGGGIESTSSSEADAKVSAGDLEKLRRMWDISSSDGDVGNKGAGSGSGKL